MDLPIPAPQLSTAEAPRALDADIIRRSHVDMPGIGAGLAALGQGMEDLSVPLAEQAGREAAAKSVTLDDQGRVQVADPGSSLMFGKAGPAYRHAVEVSAVANLANRIGPDLTDLRQKFAGDPGGFQQAYGQYAQSLREKFPGILGEDAFQRAMAGGAQHYASLTNEKANRDVQIGQQAITTQIDTLSNQMRAMARQDGTNTDDFRTNAAQLNAFYDQLGANPLFGFSKEKIEAERQRANETFQSEAVVGQVDRTFNKLGKDQAQKQLEDGILNNPSLHLSNEQRSRLYSWGMARLSYLTGEQKAQIEAQRDTVEQTVAGIRAGRVPDQVSDQVVEKMRSLGAAEEANKIIAARTVAQAAMPYQNLSPGAVGAVVGPAGTGRAFDPASPDGYLDRTKSIENPKGDPRAVSPTGASGDFQFTRGTAAQYGVIDPTNPAQARDGARRLAIDNAAFLTKTLGRAPSEAEVYLAHQQGAAGAAALIQHPEMPAVQALATYAYGGDLTKADQAIRVNGGTSTMTAGQFAQKWIGRYNGTAPSANGIPFTDAQIKENPFLLSEWVRRIAGDGKAQVAYGQTLGSGIENGLKGGLAPSANNLASFLQIAQQHPESFADQAQRITSQIQGKSIADVAGNVPPSQGQTIIDDAMRQAQGGSIYHQQVAMAARDHFAAAGRRLADTPGAEAAQRGWISQAPAPLDFSSGEALGRTMMQRDVMAKAIASHTGDATQSALQPADLEQVRSVVANGSLEQKAMLIGSFSQLSQPTLKATLAKLGSDQQTAPLAIAASIAHENPEATKGILAGADAMAKEPKLAPAADMRETAFSKAIPVPALPTTVRDSIGKATNAYYAYLSAQQNDVSGVFKQPRYDEALKAVTGGVVDHRGSKVIAPWYGANQDQFDAAVRSVSDADLAGARTTGGDPFPARMLMPSMSSFFTSNGYRLMSAGTGRYTIVSGPAEKPVPVVGSDGSAFVLDLGKKRSNPDVWNAPAQRWDTGLAAGTNQFARDNLQPVDDGSEAANAPLTEGRSVSKGASGQFADGTIDPSTYFEPVTAFLKYARTTPTVRAMSPDNYVVLPTTSRDGRALSGTDEIMANFAKTGMHFGRFKTKEEAEAAAEAIREEEKASMMPHGGK